MSQPDAAMVRRVLFEVLTEYNKVGPGYFQSTPICDLDRSNARLWWQRVNVRY
jgi:hypothetical protein